MLLQEQPVAFMNSQNPYGLAVKKTVIIDPMKQCLRLRRSAACRHYEGRWAGGFVQRHFQVGECDNMATPLRTQKFHHRKCHLFIP